ncbi:MAG: hypothetical protein ACD_23C00430G0001, partial [uncultured bacterium]
MQRPVEYDNLIKTKAFEATAPTPGALAGFLRNAADYKTSAEALDPARHLQIFTLAYEGYFQIVQAVLEFYEVRTKDVRQVSVRARGQELIVAPIGHTWDS